MGFPVEVQLMKGRIVKCIDVTFRAITNVEDVIHRSQWRYRRILFALPPKATSRKKLRTVNLRDACGLHGLAGR
jgi:hypothetical protein